MKLFWTCLAVLLCQVHGESIEVEVEELLEMVPYEQIMSVSMEYALSDPQVKNFMQYISSPQFRENVLALQSSPQFAQLAEIISAYKIDAYALANKFNSALDMPLLSYKVGYDTGREKRSPGAGVEGLVMEVAEITPLDEIREAYQYKVSHNPQLQFLVDKALSDEGRKTFEPILNSPYLREIRQDLEKMGIPMKRLTEFFQTKFDYFFSPPETPSTTYKTDEE